MLVALGWVDFDLGVPPYCPAAQPLLPHSHQPKQNWADGRITKIKVNPTQVLGQMNHPVQDLCVTQQVLDQHDLVVDGGERVEQRRGRLLHRGGQGTRAWPNP